MSPSPAKLNSIEIVQLIDYLRSRLPLRIESWQQLYDELITDVPALRGKVSTRKIREYVIEHKFEYIIAKAERIEGSPPGINTDRLVARVEALEGAIGTLRTQLRVLNSCVNALAKGEAMPANGELLQQSSNALGATGPS